MLLKLSKLTGNDSERRTYINTSMITTVGPVAGDPDSTLIIMVDRSQALIKKPVEEVVDILREHDRSLAV